MDHNIISSNTFIKKRHVVNEYDVVVKWLSGEYEPWSEWAEITLITAENSPRW